MLETLGKSFTPELRRTRSPWKYRIAISKNSTVLGVLYYQNYQNYTKITKKVAHSQLSIPPLQAVCHGDYYSLGHRKGLNQSSIACGSEPINYLIHNPNIYNIYQLGSLSHLRFILKAFLFALSFFFLHLFTPSIIYTFFIFFFSLRRPLHLFTSSPLQLYHCSTSPSCVRVVVALNPCPRPANFYFLFLLERF